MLSIFFAFAAAMAETPDHYKCQVILVAADAPGGVGEQKFTAIGPDTSTHGGPESTFNFGPNQVTVQANARWRAITWRRGQKVVAVSLTASATDLMSSVVLLAINPDKNEESVALECSPE